MLCVCNFLLAPNGKGFRVNVFPNQFPKREGPSQLIVQFISNVIHGRL